MRVVLDTNVLVSGLRSPTGASRVWLGKILERRHALLLSVPLVLEYEAVITRPELLDQIGLTGREIEEVVDALCAVGERVELYHWQAPQLTDPCDEMVLSTAIWGRAEMLITFNVRDFRPAGPFPFVVLEPGAATLKAMED